MKGNTKALRASSYSFFTWDLGSGSTSFPTGLFNCVGYTLVEGLEWDIWSPFRLELLIEVACEVRSTGVSFETTE